MYVYEESVSELAPHVREEVVFAGIVARGDRGQDVRRVQEWLNLHGFGLVVDGDHGPVTSQQVERFQLHVGYAGTGTVDEPTFAALVRPMIEILRQRLIASVSVGSAVVEYARAHLAVHPREVGGANRGPWVRLYMSGREGPQTLWCAGFVSFLLKQATQSLQVDMPIGGSVSCDSLAAQAQRAGLFLAEVDATPSDIPPGSIFLVRRTSTDWTHTGLVTAARDESFDTIEGNTNDDGLREGTEVCARTRGYASKDFIQIK